jgi:hypothetical protein
MNCPARAAKRAAAGRQRDQRHERMGPRPLERSSHVLAYRNLADTPTRLMCQRIGIMGGAVTAAVIACVGILGGSDCGSGQTCSVADYGGGAGGFATPYQALRSVLAIQLKWLSARGWVVAGRTAHAMTFRSGNGSVDVVKLSGGGWIVGGLTACQ